MKRLGVCAWVLAACASCSTSVRPPAAPATQPPAKVDASLEAKAPEVAAPQAAADPRVERVLGAVSAIRQLAAKGPVRSESVRRASMTERMRERVRAQVPPEAVRGEGEFLTAFGLLPDGFDYEQGVYALLESELAGYYEPEQQTMFLLDDLSPAEAEATLAHELVHALQDQHWNLAPLLKYRPDEADRQTALQCLAEGDATSAMLEYELRDSDASALGIPDGRLRLALRASTAMSANLHRMPSVLRNSLVAPYVEGVVLVHQQRRAGGWQAVDQLWRNPPLTTEQVLHPDKLSSREPAEVVAVPSTAALGAEWTVAHTETYGELGVRIALEEWLAPPIASRAAAGWAGDRAAVARNSQSQVAAAWVIRFDPSPAPQVNAQATEAFDAVVAGWNLASPKACKALGDRTLAVAQAGREVALISLPAGTSPVDACRRARNWAQSLVSSN